MRKSNICILVLSILALFFFSGIDAHASAIDYTPSYLTDSLKTSSPTAGNKVYHFYLGTDEVLCDETGTVYSLVGDSVVLDFEFSTISAQFPTGSYYNSYDYFNIVLTPHGTSNWASTEFDELGALLNQEAICRHYAIVNGEKYYMADDKTVTIPVANVTDDITVSFGIEVSTVIDYTGFASSDSAFTSYFGWLTFSATELSYETELVGVRYASTGEEAIVDSIISWGSIQNSSLNNIYNKLIEIKNSITVTLIQKLDAFQKEVAENFGISNLWLSDIFGEINYQAERIYAEFQNMHITLKTTIKNAIEAVQSEVGYWGLRVEEKLEEIAELLSKGYDNTDANKSNEVLDSALSDYSNEEQLLFSDASYDLYMYDFSKSLDFSAPMVSALSLITTFANSFFIASGDLSSGLTVMMALVFVSIVIGLIRFVKG